MGHCFIPRGRRSARTWYTARPYCIRFRLPVGESPLERGFGWPESRGAWPVLLTAGALVLTWGRLLLTVAHLLLISRGVVWVVR
jgi:hypothetical protein